MEACLLGFGVLLWGYVLVLMCDLLGWMVGPCGFGGVVCVV